MYSHTSIKKSPLDIEKNGLLRQVTSYKKFSWDEIFFDRTRKRWPLNTVYRGDIIGRFDYILSIQHRLTSVKCNVYLHTENTSVIYSKYIHMMCYINRFFLTLKYTVEWFYPLYMYTYETNCLNMTHTIFPTANIWGFTIYLPQRNTLLFCTL
jgi:hypothetical protein